MTDKFRMYGLVPYNISPIQQAIQYGHALQEYNNLMINVNEGARVMATSRESQIVIDNFDTWRKECKTFIILNGGTTNDSEEYTGTLNTHLQSLIDMKWIHASFKEPDLGNQLTAIVFLVPEQVYNRKLYPDFWDWENAKKVFEDKDLRKFRGEWDWETSWDDRTSRSLMLAYMEWTDTVMGGNENVNMRKWVSQFRLA